MSFRTTTRRSRRIALVLTSLGCAPLLVPAAQAERDVGVRAGKLTTCKGENAKFIKLRVANIGCGTAYNKVYNGKQKRAEPCSPGSGKPCHFTVAGFNCVYRESDNPHGVGVLVKATCKKTLKGKNGKRIKQVVRWQSTFAG